MTKKDMEQLRGLSREERKSYFLNHKSDVLSLSDLDQVNGGFIKCDGGRSLNPGSAESYFQGKCFSSFGYVCDGVEIC